MALERDRAMKRSSSAVNFDLPDLKRRNLAPIRRHKITCDIDGGNASELAFHDAGAAETLLTRSIGLALDVVGFDAAEPLALESFRVAAEECMCCVGISLQSSDDCTRYAQLDGRHAKIHALKSADPGNSTGFSASITHTSALLKSAATSPQATHIHSKRSSHPAA